MQKNPAIYSIKVNENGEYDQEKGHVKENAH
jgi:hypothetical protein